MSVSLVEILGLDLLSKVGSKIADLETENAKLREAIQKHCGHWYEPGYGPRYWIPDKWVPEALGFKPTEPGEEGSKHG
jgi:hypothetical protein